MNIVVGLGNPGEEYKKSRHNTGYIFLDKLAEGKKFSKDKKFEAEVLELNGLLLVKPSTFMNESGRAVRKILDFYKLDLSNLILVHDDLDLKLGEKKMQMGIGPKIHNGVNSVEQYVGSKNFLRIRLGIDNRSSIHEGISGADYVLGNFSNEEMAKINEVIDLAIAELLITLSL